MNETYGPNQNQNLKLRWTLAIASVLAVIVLSIWVRKLVLDSDAYFDAESSFDAIPYTDSIKAAVTQKLDASKNIVQSSLVVFAALWGLLIAKRDEKAIVLKDRPELVMFGAANVLFLLSFYCYSLYNESMATLHANSTPPGALYVDAKDLSIMDFRDKRIENIYIWQSRLLWAAFAAAGATIFSAHALKPQPIKPKEPTGDSATIAPPRDAALLAVS